MTSDWTGNYLDRFSRKELLSAFARILPILFVLGVGGGMIVGFLIGGLELAAAGLLITGMPFILSFIYMQTRNQTDNSLKTILDSDRFPLFQLYGITYSAGIIYLSLISQRGYAFFLIISVLYTLAIISTFQRDSWQGVGYAIATFLMSIYSVTLRVPLFIGGTDILPHLSYTLHIANTGSIISEQVSNYANFPLYHIFNASFIEIAGDYPERSFFIIIGMVMALSPLLVYSIALRLIHDKQFSSQVAVVYTSLPTVIYAGQYSITRTFAFIGFLIIMLSILMRGNENKTQSKIILFVGIVYLLLVHQVSYIQVLSLLFLWWGISTMVSTGDKQITFYDLMLFVAPFVAYWIYNAENFINQIVVSQILGRNISPTSQSLDTSLPVFHIFEYANAYLLGLLLLVGIVIGIKSESDSIRTTALFTLVCIPLILYSPVHIIGRLKAFRIDRFVLLLSFFTALFVAIGVRDVAKQIISIFPNQYIKVFSIFFIVFVFTSSLGGIYQDTAADSTQVSWQQPKEHVERAERAALDYTTKIPDGSRIRVDGLSYKYLSSRLVYSGSKAEITANHRIDTIQTPRDTKGEYMVYLKSRESRGNIVLGEYGGDYIYDGILPTKEKSVFYNSGSAALLTNTSR